VTLVKDVALQLKDNGVDSALTNAEEILQAILKCRRVDLYTEDVVLNLAQQQELENMVSQRITGEPLQYIIGEVNFFGNRLQTGPGVFIPRPETEVLVDVVIRYATKDHLTCDSPGHAPGEELLILDLCTGSGNVGISLTRALTHCKIIGSDISKKALSLAQRNAQLNGIGGRLEFLQADLLGIPGKYIDSFDIIAVNPPYVTSGEISYLPFEVRQEPLRALDGGDTGLFFYKRIIEASPRFLKKNGLIAFELADGISESVKALFHRSRKFTDICIYNDLNGIKRVITANCLKDG